jgi:hypothetical protein
MVIRLARAEDMRSAPAASGEGAPNGLAALALKERDGAALDIDLLLTDVMPRMNGRELRRTTPQPPPDSAGAVSFGLRG